jgi:hypothetical protein
LSAKGTEKGEHVKNTLSRKIPQRIGIVAALVPIPYEIEDFYRLNWCTPTWADWWVITLTLAYATALSAILYFIVRGSARLLFRLFGARA